MKFTITTKDCALSSKAAHTIDVYADKLMERLPHMEIDLSLLSLSLRRRKRGHLYDGSIILRLPHRPLIAAMEGHSPEESLLKGFRRILNELIKYKGQYFSSDPKHHDRQTIRGLDHAALVVY